MSESVYLKSDLLNHIATLVPNGYSVNNDHFIKTGAIYDTRIRLAYSEYFPHSAVIFAISIDYRFHQVEQIFSSIYVNNTNVPFGNEPFFATFHFAFGRNYMGDTEWFKLRKAEVYDDQSFMQIKPVLQNLINAAINFSNQYNTLSSLYNYVESKGSDYWENYRIPAVPLRAIVRKILGISYTSDLNTAITRATQAGKTDMASFYQATKNYLDQL